MQISAFFDRKEASIAAWLCGAVTRKVPPSARYWARTWLPEIVTLATPPASMSDMNCE
jgi:hypothetical protein